MPTDGRPSRLYYLVAPSAAGVLVPALRRHFTPEPRVAVLVERRAPAGGTQAPGPPRPARRRSPVAERDATRGLPSALRTEAHHLRLVQPMAPVGREHESTDLATLVARAVALEPAATSELWWRLSPRALARLELRAGRRLDGDAPAALLGRILDELPGYDPARQELAVWLDAVVDGYTPAA